jgi:hypothetical protein
MRAISIDRRRSSRADRVQRFAPGEMPAATSANHFFLCASQAHGWNALETSR